MTSLSFLLIGGGVAMGSSLGSFFAAWKDRSQRGLKCDDPPRSECPGCHRTLSWWDNVPLFSYLVLRGRCRSCGWGIPFWYFAYEMVGAAAGGFLGVLFWAYLRSSAV